MNAGRARSIDKITAALFELLETTPFAGITVTEICEKADVARKTFYRIFKSKTDVVERLVDQVFYEFTQKFDFGNSSAKKIYLYWFEYILCTREFSAIFFDPDLYVFITGKLCEFVEYEYSTALDKTLAVDPLLADYCLNFIAAGISAIMREWMKNDCKTPAKTMAAVTSKLLGGLIG